jgi:hypothetical protein
MFIEILRKITFEFRAKIIKTIPNLFRYYHSRKRNSEIEIALTELCITFSFSQFLLMKFFVYQYYFNTLEFYSEPVFIYSRSEIISSKSLVICQQQSFSSSLYNRVFS